MQEIAFCVKELDQNINIKAILINKPYKYLSSVGRKGNEECRLDGKPECSFD